MLAGSSRELHHTQNFRKNISWIRRISFMKSSSTSPQKYFLPFSSTTVMSLSLPKTWKLNCCIGFYFCLVRVICTAIRFFKSSVNCPNRPGYSLSIMSNTAHNASQYPLMYACFACRGFRVIHTYITILCGENIAFYPQFTIYDTLSYFVNIRIFY